MRLVRFRDSAIILLLVFCSVVYSLPNLYTEYPSVELKLSDTSIDSVRDLLANHDISISSEVIGEQSWLTFSSTDVQMQAKSLIEKHYPDAEPALNLKRNIPSWLVAIGAKPMKLGLDLRGGVHLLLEVDTRSIEHKMLEQRVASLTSMFKHVDSSTLTNAQSAHATLTYKSEHRKHLLDELSKSHIQTVSVSDEEIIIIVPSKESDYTDTINAAVNQTLKSLDKRINELGIAEATVSRQGSNFISVDLPGIQDISRAKALIGKTATLRFHMVADGKTEADHETLSVDMRQIGPMSLEKDPVISGDSIIFARAQRDDHSGVVVHIGIDPSREKFFYETTSTNVGRRLAVVYVENKKDMPDVEEIISAPVIQSGLGSQFQITGMQNYAQAQDLAMLLRSGALAAPVHVVEEATIGPSLGEDNIYKGVTSLLAASGFVFIFMAFYYRTYGMVANLALVVNVLMIIAALSIMDATLTLPGIAGVVLTVGMAVDANILINERIREEIRSGESLRKSISLGFKRAFDTIFDSNMSTLLVAMILFGMGSGSIKGFAITLTIGILASLFTSVFLTKYCMNIISQYRSRLSCGFDFFNHESKVKFMKLKNKALALSLCLVLGSTAAIAYYGVTLGLDFTGGMEMRLDSEQTLMPEVLREDLKSAGLDNAIVQSVGGFNHFIVRFASLNYTSDEIKALIKDEMPDVSVAQVQIIGPQIGAELLQTALWSMILALIGCTCYIAMRFEWRFAMAAFISLLHDPVLILGMLALTGIEFNLITLAAVLTVMGYSLNDTIVIYDRVRETFQKRRDIGPEESINISTNQTLSRTLLTSGLTLMVVLCLALLGGESLAGFSWSLIVGIVIGTYSSIYVAGTLAVQFGLKREHLVKKRYNKPVASV